MQIHGKSKGKKRLPDELSDEEYEDEVSKRHNHRLLEDDNKDKEKVALLPIRLHLFLQKKHLPLNGKKYRP